MQAVYSEHEIQPSAKYKMDMPLLTNGSLANGGVDTEYLYRSLLSKWNDKTPLPINLGFFNAFYDKPETTVSECLGYDLQALLYFANFGTLMWQPAKNFHDGLIVNSKKFNIQDFRRKGNANLYSYSLTVPKGTGSVKKTQQLLKEDLERTFGFTSTIEMRSGKVLELIVLDTSKVNSYKSTSIEGKYGFKFNEETYMLTNISIADFILNLLESKVNVALRDAGKSSLKILDQTNLKFKLDFNINIKDMSFEQIEVQLNRVGFDLIERDMMMNYIVVKDAL